MKNINYIRLLEKMANEDSDVEKVVRSDYKKNLSDNREYLGGIFTRASAVEDTQSSEIKKLFPSTDGDRESGNPLMKVARAAFHRSTQNVGLSPIYSELAFQSFCDELEKIVDES